MKVRTLQIGGLALAAMAGMNSALLAADRPSQSALAEMGLAGMIEMSDNEALAVRGFGYSPARAAGFGWATVVVKGASAGSVNSYSAEGKHKAWGENYSEAGVEVEQSGGYGGGHKNKGGKGGGQSFGIVAFSGGSSIAGRK